MEEQMYNDEYEISLKELIEVIWKHKFLIAIITVAGAVLAFAGGKIYDGMQSEVATVVTMQWNGVAAGEYPDGTRFDYTEMLEPYVISLAVSDLELDVSTDEVRTNLSISPIVPSNILVMIENSIESGNPITYYATDYKLVLNNGALDLTVDEAKDLLNEIIYQYRIDFERQYINQVSVFDFTSQDLELYDYIDAHDILNTQLELIEAAMSTYEDVNFISPTLGVSFSDITVRSELVKRIELNQIQSRTNSFLLTKDIDFLIINYSYKIDTLQLDLDKALAKQAELQILIDNYVGSTQTIIIPGMSDTSSIEIDTYYNTLIQNQLSYQEEIADLEQDIAHYQLQIDRLNGEDPDFLVTNQQVIDESAKVEEYIVIADEKLSEIVNDANVLLTEYNAYVTSNIIKPLMAPEYQPNVNVMLYTLIGLILGGMIGTGFVLGKHFWNAE